MRSLTTLFHRAYRVLKEEGPRALGRRARMFLSRRIAYLKRWQKIRRVKRAKAEIEGRNSEYNHHPTVSFALQSFNRAENVDHLATHIPQASEYETIILEDGSVDGSLEKWDDHLTRRNDFLIRSNDLHEIRTYERAAQFSRGDYLCLLQDDDTLPARTEWIEWVLEFFDAYPDLAVVGGYVPVGLGSRFESPHDKVSHDGSIPPISEWDWGRNDEKFPLVDGDPLPIVDPITERPLLFVPIVSVGPFVIDMDVFDELGGFDLDYSEPGEPGIFFDGEFSLRCWRTGYRVGYVNMGNYGETAGATVGGTELYDKETLDAQVRRNLELLERDHGSAFDLIEERVCDANADLERADDPAAVQGLNLRYCEILDAPEDGSSQADRGGRR